MKLQRHQKRILEYLLKHPEGAALDELAGHLAVTRTAAREQIVGLEASGYLTFVDTKGGVGRPKRRYVLSETGQEGAPRHTPWISNLILEYFAKSLEPERVSRIVEELSEVLAKQVQMKMGKPDSAAKLFAKLTEELTELGFQARLRQSDLRKGGLIEATHCVYHSVAKKFPILCQLDVSFIAKASQMNVDLETCINHGDPTCRFRIRKQEPA